MRVTDPRAIPTTLGGRLKAYVALTKPRIIELLLVTTVPALCLFLFGIVLSPDWNAVGMKILPRMYPIRPNGREKYNKNA